MQLCPDSVTAANGLSGVAARELFGLTGTDEVVRDKEDALITKDRMRVDMVAEFYVRVAPTREAVSIAAATLGRRTLEHTRLHELLSEKFIGALRSVGAEMTLEEMHERRGDYVTKVKAAASKALEMNGLELESVAITELDQRRISPPTGLDPIRAPWASRLNPACIRVIRSANQSSGTRGTASAGVVATISASSATLCVQSTVAPVIGLFPWGLTAWWSPSNTRPGDTSPTPKLSPIASGWTTRAISSVWRLNVL